jgi:hypothetical protein
MQLAQGLNFSNIYSNLGQNSTAPFQLSTTLTLGNIINALILYLFPLVGLAMLLYLVYGGYQYMLSRGDPKAVEQAKSTLTTAIVGFIIVFAAYWIVQIFGIIFGLPDIANIFR